MPQNFIENLQKQLTHVPLPGLEAQLKMAPPTRREMLDDRYRLPENPRVAAVMCLLFWKNKEWHVVLIERTSDNPADRHAGQISFPGGKFEETDLHFEKTALRETEEEIGILAEKVTVLGRLTELFIPVSGFLVHPFVGFLPENMDWRPQPTEVKTILEVPIFHLQKPENRLVRDLSVGPGLVYKNIPIFEIEGRTVWGATAMILSEFLTVVAEISPLRK